MKDTSKANFITDQKDTTTPVFRPPPSLGSYPTEARTAFFITSPWGMEVIECILKMKGSGLGHLNLRNEGVEDGKGFLGWDRRDTTLRC